MVPSELLEVKGEPLVLWTIASDRELELVVTELEVSVTLGPSLIISDDSPSFQGVGEDPRFQSET